MFKKYFSLLIIVLTGTAMHGQYLRGMVVDKDTGETLPGTTLYIDGTTVATATDGNGNFSLNIKGLKGDLMVTFIGYATLRISEPGSYENKSMKVVLEKESISLDEVIIGKGPFSRKEMMRVFKEQFLGTTRAGNSCTLLNEEAVFLYFDVTNNTLKASAKEPIRIRNKYLEYEIIFDLVDFELQFSMKTLNTHSLRQSLFSGTSFYKDISKNDKATKKRYENFFGSAAHFMQTMAYESWEKEQFSLFVNGFKDDPNKYFEVKDTLGLKQVTLIKAPQKTVTKVVTNLSGTLPETTKKEFRPVMFNLLYKKDKQSIFEFKEKVIFIDENGNYNPIFGIIFGGYLGTLKLGNLLPLDYYQTIKDRKQQ